jgi:hypothetical protein
VNKKMSMKNEEKINENYTGEFSWKVKRAENVAEY